MAAASMTRSPVPDRPKPGGHHRPPARVSPSISRFGTPDHHRSHWYCYRRALSRSSSAAHSPGRSTALVARQGRRHEYLNLTVVLSRPRSQLGPSPAGLVHFRRTQTSGRRDCGQDCPIRQSVGDWSKPVRALGAGENVEPVTCMRERQGTHCYVASRPGRAENDE
jgi:hypothetical protein